VIKKGGDNRKKKIIKKGPLFVVKRQDCDAKFTVDEVEEYRS
jgi:hypothetical protein